MNIEVVGKNIDRFRRNKGMSVRKLAKAIDISDTTVQYWIKGKGLPGGYALYRLSRFLGVPMEKIMEGIEDDEEQKHSNA